MEPLLNRNEEIVSFPVPKRFLSVVVQALAQAMAAEEAAHGPVSAGVASNVIGPQTDNTTCSTVTDGKHDGANSPRIDWTKEENARRLRRRLRLKIALKLLDMTAERAGELVSFAEVSEAAGFETTQQAGSSLGAFTKVIKREFGVSRDDAVWPVEHHWAAGGDAQYYYRMQPEVADAWRRSAS